MFCNRLVVMAVNNEDYQRWEAGELIQIAFPYLDLGQREILISGMCGTCFDDSFKDKSEE